MRKGFPLLILLGCAIGFVLGLAHLLKLRFDLGDVYPEYSSLRADPLGAMAFCESLERMPGISVRRDFSAKNQLPDGKDTTYLHLGARTSAWRSLDEDLLKEIEGFVTGGGRLAITFFPETAKPFQLLPDPTEPEPKKSRKKEARQKTEPAKQKKTQRREEAKRRLLRRTSLRERWGVEFDFLPLETGSVSAYEPAPAKNQTELPLPDTLDWHSATIFTNLPSSWQIIYARGANPVVIQRRFGSGTIVMASDSYFLSNEALRKDRRADLLSWWVGPAKHVLFDEAHFGIVETEGVAALLRKYRLHGLAAGLILLTGLFIWKNSVSFVPPFQRQQEQAYVPGKEAAAGFVNLLRRNIPKRDVLNVCFAEWKKSSPQALKHAPAKQAQAEVLLQAENTRSQRDRTPVTTYREICQLLKKI